jgi:hypothetical protein
MLGWSTKGLRCPDYTISFEDSNGALYPVNLIQMPNGTGKTTTLNLLRATLSGAADIEKWGPGKIRSYQKKNSPQTDGEFQVSIASNGKRVTLTLLFDFDEGTIKYTTTIGQGKDIGFHPPRECRDFFSPDFINFFVFNGELAQQLLDPHYANAERAIVFLFRLKHLNSIKKVVADYWENIIDNGKAFDIRALTRRKNKVYTLAARIAELTKERAKIQASYNKINAETEILRNKFDVKIREMDYYGKEYEEQEILHNISIKEVDLLTQQLLKSIRSPHILSAAFAENILTLKNNLDKVKLPESTAKEFFEELANEEDCICGRPLDEEHRKSIRDRASNYLGSEEMALLNSIKSEIADQIGQNPKEHETKFKESLKKYKQAIQVRGKAKTDLDAVEERLTGGNTVLQEAKERISNLEEQLLKLTEDLRKYTDKDETKNDDKTYGIEVLEQRLKDARDKLAEITDTVEIKDKTVIINSIINKAQRLSHKIIADNIKNEANDRIKNLLPNNDIRISEIDNALHLEGQDAGSEGETLSVAYAFMSTLFNSADRQLPFIVDSPANAIDLKVREQVAKLIPKLTNQFIAFTISSERDGFVFPLEKACQGAIQYITLFRKGDQELEEQAKDFNNTIYTNDGVLVTGKEYFWKFHKDSEVED